MSYVSDRGFSLQELVAIGRVIENPDGDFSEAGPELQNIQRIIKYVNEGGDAKTIIEPLMTFSGIRPWQLLVDALAPICPDKNAYLRCVDLSFYIGVIAFSTQNPLKGEEVKLDPDAIELTVTSETECADVKVESLDASCILASLCGFEVDTRFEFDAAEIRHVSLYKLFSGMLISNHITPYSESHLLGFEKDVVLTPRDILAVFFNMSFSTTLHRIHALDDNNQAIPRIFNALYPVFEEDQEMTFRLIECFQQALDTTHLGTLFTLKRLDLIQKLPEDEKHIPVKWLQMETLQANLNALAATPGCESFAMEYIITFGLIPELNEEMPWTRNITEALVDCAVLLYGRSEEFTPKFVALAFEEQKTLTTAIFNKRNSGAFFERIDYLTICAMILKHKEPVFGHAFCEFFSNRVDAAKMTPRNILNLIFGHTLSEGEEHLLDISKIRKDFSGSTPEVPEISQEMSLTLRALKDFLKLKKKLIYALPKDIRQHLFAQVRRILDSVMPIDEPEYTPEAFQFFVGYALFCDEKEYNHFKKSYSALLTMASLDFKAGFQMFVPTWRAATKEHLSNCDKYDRFQSVYQYKTNASIRSLKIIQTLRDDDQTSIKARTQAFIDALKAGTNTDSCVQEIQEDPYLWLTLEPAKIALHIAIQRRDHRLYENILLNFVGTKQDAIALFNSIPFDEPTQRFLTNDFCFLPRQHYGDSKPSNLWALMTFFAINYYMRQPEIFRLIIGRIDPDVMDKNALNRFLIALCPSYIRREESHVAYLSNLKFLADKPVLLKKYLYGLSEGNRTMTPMKFEEVVGEQNPYILHLKVCIEKNKFSALKFYLKSLGVRPPHIIIAMIMAEYSEQDSKALLKLVQASEKPIAPEDQAGLLERLKSSWFLSQPKQVKENILKALQSCVFETSEKISSLALAVCGTEAEECAGAGICSGGAGGVEYTPGRK